MGLNYSHTCPDIDKNIKEFQGSINSYLSDMLDDCCPLLEGEQKVNFIKDYSTQIYDDFANCSESIRTDNEDMRKEADKQINDAEYELNDIKGELDDKCTEISDLETQIDELQHELKNSNS